MTYLTVKSLHLVAIALSIAGFTLRGYWMMSQSDRLQLRVVRIAPHVIDTVLLASGIAMLVMLRIEVISQPWMLAKLAGLAAYIILGTIALKRGSTRAIRITAFVAALLAFAYIVGAAMLKSPASWLASVPS